VNLKATARKTVPGGAPPPLPFPLGPTKFARARRRGWPGNSAQRGAAFLPRQRPDDQVFPSPRTKSPRNRTSLTPP